MLGLPWWLRSEEFACWHRLDPWVGKIPWRRKWQPTPVLLPGESCGQRSLAGYCLRGRKEPDKTYQLNNSHSLCVWGYTQQRESLQWAGELIFWWRRKKNREANCTVTESRHNRLINWGMSWARNNDFISKARRLRRRQSSVSKNHLTTVRTQASFILKREGGVCVCVCVCKLFKDYVPNYLPQVWGGISVAANVLRAEINRN